MHYAILVKIRADSSDEALAEAKDQVEQSCGDGCPFDYMSDEITPVTKEALKEQGVTNFKELERKWKDLLDDYIAEHKGGVKDEVFLELCKRYLSGKDALTYLNYKDHYGNVDDKVQDLIEAAAKTKTTKPKLPVGLDELAGIVADLIRPPDAHLAMGAYHLKQLDKLYDCKTYPDETSNTLYCYDCHFANLGGTGKRAYYFLFDRHA
jgi:hypothetical protein